MRLKDRKAKQLNNAGFSLVELLVAIAIFAIISTAFYEFALMAMRHYQKGAMDVEVQYEAQLAMNQLQDLVIDSSKGISYTVNGSTSYILSDSEIPTGTTVTNKQIALYNTDGYYVVEWSAADKKLYFSEYESDGVGGWTTVTNRVLMAEYVRDFSVDLSSFTRNNSVELDLVFHKDRKYQVTQTVKVRNQVAVNKTRVDLYGS